MTLPSGSRAALLPLMGAVLGALGAGIYEFTGMGALGALLAAMLWSLPAWFPKEAPAAHRLVDATALAGLPLRWLAIQNFATHDILIAFIAAQAVSRSAMIALSWASRPAANGVGMEFAATLNSPAALIAIVEGTIAALVCGWRSALVILLCAYFLIRLAQTLFYQRSGGVDANALGVTTVAVELATLSVFTFSIGG